MDRTFLEYYEEELTHIRSLAREFAAIHPNVARNLQIESAPCPDPYVERLLEGVAYLAARTRLKVDGEASRYVRSMMDTLYPDIAGPGPAMSIACLEPGPQVQRMIDGHVVERGTRVVSGLRQGLKTRCVYTMSQAVHLWPIKLTSVDYLQDKGALNQNGVPESKLRDASAGIRIVIERSGPGDLSELSLDQFDVYFGAGSRGGSIFDAVYGSGIGAIARVADRKSSYADLTAPRMIGASDDESLLPRVRHSFEGYRLLREYFMMPERFYYMRLNGLRRVVEQAAAHPVEIIVLLSEGTRGFSDIGLNDLRLFATPVVNLFEHECNFVEIDRAKSQHIVHADRSRPRDFEIYRLLRVEDAENDGPEARVRPLFSTENNADSGYVYSTERRPRRPDEGEIRRGQPRTSYTGDDFFISVAKPAANKAVQPIRKLDIRALCTNRDLAILDDTPVLSMDTGDPVTNIELLQPMRRPRPSLGATLPTGSKSEAAIDDLTWRWVGQLSLNHISLAADEADAEPLRALIKLYADRGDPNLARQGRSIVRVRSRRLLERLAKPGPLCFGHGTEISLEVNETLLSGTSELLLSALLARLFTRHTSINSFVRTKTRLTQQQKEVTWPMMPGTRALI